MYKNLVISHEGYRHWRRTVHNVENCEEDINARVPLDHAIHSREARALFRGFRNSSCLRCEKSLVLVQSNQKRQPTDSKGSCKEFRLSIMKCQSCGWWRLTDYFENYYHYGDYDSREDFFEGIVRHYDIRDKAVPLRALRLHLLNSHDNFCELDPTAFESLVGDIYNDFYDCEVRHVGGPGDNGIDLFAIIGEEPHLVQAKRRQSTGAVESVSTVREFVGTLFLEGAKKGHVVTTASRFSRAAEELVGNNNLRRYGVEISLKSRANLIDMLHLSTDSKNSPWEGCDPTMEGDLEQEMLPLSDITTRGPFNINATICAGRVEYLGEEFL